MPIFLKAHHLVTNVHQSHAGSMSHPHLLNRHSSDTQNPKCQSKALISSYQLHIRSPQNCYKDDRKPSAVHNQCYFFILNQNAL